MGNCSTACECVKPDCKPAACDARSCSRYPSISETEEEELSISCLSRDAIHDRLKHLAGLEEAKRHFPYTSTLGRVLELLTDSLAMSPGSAALVVVAPRSMVDSWDVEFDDDGELLQELEGATVFDQRFKASLIASARSYDKAVDSQDRPIEDVFVVDHVSGEIILASARFPSGDAFMSAIEIAVALGRGVVFTRSTQGVVDVFPAVEVQWGRALQVISAEDNSVEVATMLDHLGNGHLQKGNPQSAKPLLERALYIEEMHYGKDHVQVGLTLDSLGTCYTRLGNPDLAKMILERALDINTKNFGANNVQVAWTLDNLGCTLRDLGDIRQAQALHERALAIYQGAYGPEDKMLTQTIELLAHTHRGLGNPAAAQPLYTRVLALLENEVEADPAHVAITHNNLGNAARELGDVEDAVALYQTALEIGQEHFGDDHAEVGRTLNNLGLALLELGEQEEARDLFVRALSIFKIEFGSKSSYAAIAGINLATCLATLGDKAEASKCLEQAEASMDAAAGPIANLELAWRAAAVRFAVGDTSHPTPQDRWHGAESIVRKLIGLDGLKAVCQRCKEGLTRIWEHTERDDMIQWLMDRNCPIY